MNESTADLLKTLGLTMVFMVTASLIFVAGILVLAAVSWLLS